MSGKYWDFGFNWGLGCSWASRGCDRCYALQAAARMLRNPNPKISQRWEYLLEFDEEGKPRWTGATRFMPQVLNAAIRRRKGAVYFTSMFDPFHPNIPDWWRDQALAAMVLCEQHTFIWSTKRPDLAAWYFAAEDLLERVKNLLWPTFVAAWGEALGPVAGFTPEREANFTLPLRNFILMATVEDQAAFNARWPHLAECAPWAGELALSYEPALGPVDFWPALGLPEKCPHCGHGARDCRFGFCRECGQDLDTYQPQVYRVFAGGETGKGARPAHPKWFKSAMVQVCWRSAGVFHFKSWGEWRPAKRKGDLVLIPSDIHPECRFIDAQGQKVEKDYTTAMLRVGARRSGRILCGKEHNAKPAAGIVNDEDIPF